MFGSNSNPADDTRAHSPLHETSPESPRVAIPGSNGRSSDSPAGRKPSEDDNSPKPADRKRRSSGVSKAREMFSSAKAHFHTGSPTAENHTQQSTIQKLGKNDPALVVPQGALNNSAGESAPTARSTFRVGVTEDKNKKCRRTMEDTHAYLYNFLSTPSPALGSDAGSKSTTSVAETTNSTVSDPSNLVVESDNGYFAIFDGHAGTFAADWCGKKLHLLLEEIIRKNPNTPIPELLDQTFTTVDQQLEKLPLKNSGCTAVIAVLRWEDRIPNSHSATGSAFFAPAAAAAVKAASDGDKNAETPTAKEPNADGAAATEAQRAEAKVRENAERQRVLYTANVGDARIVLCRNGRALRLSYDHKGSDEAEGRRVSNAGGLILNNRVNGVLAVTRALGDAYMKDLVTGHPYTTETVIQPEQDEFLILACDGLWDVCNDQEAVDLVRHIQDPQEASKKLVDHALSRFSTDNLSCMIVRFDNKAIKQLRDGPATEKLGVDGDVPTKEKKGGITEAEAIVQKAKKQVDEGVVPTDIVTAILEQEEGAEAMDQDPGPELNMEALEKAKTKKETS